jgi:hypothetical protein
MSSLVALRDRREQVIARLSEGYAQDLLDVDELDRRLDLAHAASTVAELDALVADLAPETGAALVPAGTRAIDDPARASRKKLSVWFGNVERKGTWSVPLELRTRVVFGSGVLDFREASIGPGTTTVNVGVTFGSLELILPPGLAIDVDVSSLAGNVEERHRVPRTPDPDQPILRVTGGVRFGNLEISTRLPGETARDARRREKRERKQLAGDRKQLGSGDK